VVVNFNMIHSMKDDVFISESGQEGVTTVTCITLHSRFEAVCVAQDVLHAVLVLLHDSQASTLQEPVVPRCVM